MEAFALQVFYQALSFFGGLVCGAAIVRALVGNKVPRWMIRPLMELREDLDVVNTSLLSVGNALWERGDKESADQIFRIAKQLVIAAARIRRDE